jgi:hypothetical protein
VHDIAGHDPVVGIRCVDAQNDDAFACHTAVLEAAADDVRDHRPDHCVAQ